MEIRDPGTASSSASARLPPRDDLDRAVDAAREAYKSWSRSSDDERKAAVNRIADKVHEHMEELAELLTREQGKPLNGMGSRFELHGAEAWARHYGQLDLPVEVLQRRRKRPRRASSQAARGGRLDHAVEFPGADRDLAHRARRSAPATPW